MAWWSQKQTDEAEVVVRIFGAKEFFDRGEAVLATFACTHLLKRIVDSLKLVFGNVAAEIVDVEFWILASDFFDMVEDGF